MSQQVRVGEVEDVVFTLSRNGVAYDLSSITSVTLRWRNQAGTTGSTDDLTGLLSVTDATAGEVTLSPDTDFWADSGHYDVYLDVLLAGKVYSFGRTDNYRFIIVSEFS
jgi:hypothetical protein